MKHINLRGLIKSWAGRKYSWTAVFLITFLCVNFYVFVEWIFTITKPSFLSGVPFFQKTAILLFSSSSIYLAFFILLAVLSVPFFRAAIGRKNGIMLIGLAIPAFISACTILIITDNFTYTVFRFGIVSTNWTRVLYLAFFLLVFFFFWYALGQTAAAISEFHLSAKRRKWIIPVLSQLSIACLLIGFSPNQAAHTDAIEFLSDPSAKKPNIILMTADGLDASHLSIYGYSRETSPNIQALAKSSLIAENAFTNSANTAGSLISIYTGKYPSTTRVLYPPDILKDQDSFEHLPGILQANGYYTVQFSFPYYADAYDLNLSSGFDVVNGRSIQDDSLGFLLTKSLETNRAYFIYGLTNRILDRLKHIFFIRKMENFGPLVHKGAKIFDDNRKLDLTYELFEEKEQPLFVHIHWMGTHGPYFFPRSTSFSTGVDRTHQGEWDLDLYDDSILDFDLAIGELIDFLKTNGEFDNTIIIIGTDHGQNYVTNKKIPLMFHFPNDDYSGRLANNVQNLDIAPTLLSYLGIDQPDWMEGGSLLGQDLGSRPIIAFGANLIQPNETNLVVENTRPPFYQLGYISLVVCDRYYQLNLLPEQWSVSFVNQSTVNCKDDLNLPEEQAFSFLRDHLKSNEFDVSGLHGPSNTD
jgi:hypothetical protein